MTKRDCNVALQWGVAWVYNTLKGDEQYESFQGEGKA